MKDLAGKTAVITGGGSGIGRATGLALAEAGMNIVVADINLASAQTVAEEIAAYGVRALALRTDVAEEVSVEELAQRAYDEFGAVHVLHNNAGIGSGSPDASPLETWTRVLAVNVMGVVYGLEIFVPLMRAQGGEAHIVNTSSLAGLVATPGMATYNASKYAVVAISETLRADLAPHGIGVSVLCPSLVNTNIGASSGQSQASRAPVLNTIRRLEAEDVGPMVRHGIETNEPYIFTHPELGPTVQRRFDRIAEALQRAAARDS